MKCTKYGGTCEYRKHHTCIATDYECKYQVLTDFEKKMKKKEGKRND